MVDTAQKPIGPKPLPPPPPPQRPKTSNNGGSYFPRSYRGNAGAPFVDVAAIEIAGRLISCYGMEPKVYPKIAKASYDMALELVKEKQRRAITAHEGGKTDDEGR